MSARNKDARQTFSRRLERGGGGSAISLNEIAHFLDGYFATYRYADDQGGVYHASSRPIRRLGVALEPWPGLPAWVEAEKLDALFLHRPWTLEPTTLPDDIGIIAYHLPFDERLAIGFSHRLARALGMVALENLGEKERRVIGMIGAVARQPFDAYVRHVGAVFGDLEEVLRGSTNEVRRVAVVGAMNEPLVQEAAERGAEVYVTGQSRQPALPAVNALGINVIAVGHQRSEFWGIRALAGVLRERWARLDVLVQPPNPRLQ
jgi:putative NIF3 family GTP cyclohydrolase 1 type 2